MRSDVRFADGYLDDLDAVIDNLWLVSSAAVDRFAEAHDTCVQRILAVPRIGEREKGSRYSLPVAKTGYRIVYRVESEVVVFVGDRERAAPKTPHLAFVRYNQNI